MRRAPKVGLAGCSCSLGFCTRRNGVGASPKKSGAGLGFACTLGLLLCACWEYNANARAFRNPERAANPPGRGQTGSTTAGLAFIRGRFLFGPATPDSFKALFLPSPFPFVIGEKGRFRAGHRSQVAGHPLSLFCCLAEDVVHHGVAHGCGQVALVAVPGHGPGPDAQEVVLQLAQADAVGARPVVQHVADHLH